MLENINDYSLEDLKKLKNRSIRLLTHIKAVRWQTPVKN